MRIVTDNYKAKDWQPSYLKQLKIETQYNSADNLTMLSKPSQSEHYIDNVEIENNKENIVFEGSTPTAINLLYLKHIRSERMSLWINYIMFQIGLILHYTVNLSIN